MIAHFDRRAVSWLGFQILGWAWEINTFSNRMIWIVRKSAAFDLRVHPRLTRGPLTFNSRVTHVQLAGHSRSTRVSPTCNSRVHSRLTRGSSTFNSWCHSRSARVISTLSSRVYPRACVPLLLSHKVYNWFFFQFIRKTSWIDKFGVEDVLWNTMTWKS
jgi:hypothetical protein